MFSRFVNKISFAKINQKSLGFNKLHHDNSLRFLPPLVPTKQKGINGNICRNFMTICSKSEKNANISLILKRALSTNESTKLITQKKTLPIRKNQQLIPLSATLIGIPFLSLAFHGDMSMSLTAAQDTITQ